MIEQGLRALPFPFAEIDVPELSMRVRWRLEDLGGYLATWTSVQRFTAVQGRDPVAALMPDLAAAWGDTELRTVAWRLDVRVGRRT